MLNAQMQKQYWIVLYLWGERAGTSGALVYSSLHVYVHLTWSLETELTHMRHGRGVRASWALNALNGRSGSHGKEQKKSGKIIKR